MMFSHVSTSLSNVYYSESGGLSTLCFEPGFVTCDHTRSRLRRQRGSEV